MHCGMGMVGSINAPSSGNTYDSFLAAAKAIGQNEQLVSLLYYDCRCIFWTRTLL